METETRRDGNRTVMVTVAVTAPACLLVSLTRHHAEMCCVSGWKPGATWPCLAEAWPDLAAVAPSCAYGVDRAWPVSFNLAIGASP